ncbi:MAG: hypothetical protein QNJ72_14140 [Pleurocapsa sp. MO_226.B13]|nr:hypothetical protein [Pleurocapsa sp. MO_226.B13]
MATKTLGIKFEVAGVREAQVSLDNFKNSLERSLQQNKKAVRETAKLSNIDTRSNNNPPQLKIVSSISQELSDWGDRFTQQLEKSLSVSKSATRGLFDNAITGFQEGIGNELARQYTGGIDKGLEGKLFKFFENNGIRQGRFASRIGSSVAKRIKSCSKIWLKLYNKVSNMYIYGQICYNLAKFSVDSIL